MHTFELKPRDPGFNTVDTNGESQTFTPDELLAWLRHHVQARLAVKIMVDVTRSIKRS